MKNLLLLSLFILSNAAYSQAFNHNARIPHTKLKYKDIYGVYHGKTKDMGQNFQWQIRVKKIEGRSGLFYYRDSEGDRCHGRYQVRSQQKDQFSPQSLVIISAEKANCSESGSNFPVGLVLPGEKPMDGKRGPRRFVGKVQHGMAFIPSHIFKVIISRM